MCNFVSVYMFDLVLRFGFQCIGSGYFKVRGGRDGNKTNIPATGDVDPTLV